MEREKAIPGWELVLGLEQGISRDHPVGIRGHGIPRMELEDLPPGFNPFLINQEFEGKKKPLWAQTKSLETPPIYLENESKSR